MELPGRRAPRLLLELDLTRRVLEVAPSTPVEMLAARQATVLRHVVDALAKAARDDRVAGLIAHIGTGQPTLAQSTELRDAVAAFGEEGRATVCWSESYGPELGPGNVGYHLATAFREIWIQPSGTLGFVGVTASALFVRDALDKLGIEPQISKRREYKTAADTFVERGMTEANREMLTAIAGSATSVVLRDVAAARNMEEQAVRDAVDAAPLSAAEALRRGLVDRIGYRDEAYADVRRRLGDVRLRYLERYGRTRHRRGAAALLRRHKPVIGVVQAAGAIHPGRSRRTPLVGRSVGSETIGATLRTAATDERVKAVVLRVDSPGGSYVASDAIRREVHVLRQAGKPVVASMASVAASGGYFISMPADVVVAAPVTLTGSIGVLAGKQVVRDALQRVGVRRDSVSAARHAEMFSSWQRFDDEEWQRLESWLDRVYDDFTAKAADDRGMPLEQLRDVARGRVWTGVDALRVGLVDELGGLEVAIDRACDRAGLARDRVEVRALPRVGPLARLVRPANSESPAAASAEAGPLLQQALVAAGLPPYGVLTMPMTVTLR
ncbi:MAG: signal peptide peptidase SppA [Actinomycetes bacterium]